MKAKSAYKPRRRGPETPEMAGAAMSEPAPEAPKLEPAADSPAALAEKVEEQQLEYEKRVEQADEAARALKARLAEIERSSELNRQYQAQMAQMAATQRPTREQLLEQWRRQGVSPANLEFLEAHPRLIDAWELTYYSANRATQEGHQPDTDAHREATRRIFDRYYADGEKLAAQDSDPSLQPTPEFFKAELPSIPAPRQQPSKSSHYSAPVSRETPANRIYEAENNPKSVRLDADQLEAARISGVTPTEYAKQLLRMKRMQASGESQP
jgi:hypothetical protein